MESASLLPVNSVREQRSARHEAQGADFGDLARRESLVRALVLLGKPWQAMPYRATGDSDRQAAYFQHIDSHILHIMHILYILFCIFAA